MVDKLQKKNPVEKKVSDKKRISVGDFQIGEEESAAIKEVLDAGRISEWRKVNEFDKLPTMALIVDYYVNQRK